MTRISSGISFWERGSLNCKNPSSIYYIFICLNVTLQIIKIYSTPFQFHDSSIAYSFFLTVKSLSHRGSGETPLLDLRTVPYSILVRSVHLHHPSLCRLRFGTPTSSHLVHTRLQPPTRPRSVPRGMFLSTGMQG